MTNTDLSSSSKPHQHRRVSLRQPLRCGFTIVLCSCLFFGATQCRAQDSQDVAEAARQERARKEQQAKKQKHVYTDEDLRRAKILTQEDEALVEAQRKQQPAPTEEQAPIDANTGLAQLPLGDIARRYRNAKLAAQAPDPFHLPFDEPVFAAPVISVPNPEPPRPSFSPAHPNVLPARPKVAAVAPAVSSPAPVQRLDPAISLPKPTRPAQTFSPVHPNLMPVHPSAVIAPAVPSPSPLRRLDPFTRRFAPPAPPSASRNALSAPQPKMAPAIEPSALPRIAAPSIVPSAPKSSVAASVAPPSTVARTSSPLHTVIIQPGDSLWKLAQQNLGRGSRWQELLAANPGIKDPTRIAAGTEIVVPAKVTGLKSDLKVIVKSGDTLSNIARVTYGHAAAWRCIAQANPEIADANRIYKGQQLLLPFNCQQ
jgi:nucleoid-associated protein YgaU